MHRFLFIFCLIFTEQVFSEKAVLQLSEKGRVGINFDEHYEPEANLDINGFMKLTPMPSPPPLPRDGMVYLSTEGKLYLYFNKKWSQINLSREQPLHDLTFHADIIASSQRGGNSSPSRILYGNSNDWVIEENDPKTWIHLKWEVPQTISKLILRNRQINNAEFSSGTIAFSDGSHLKLESIPAKDNLEVAFKSKTVSGLKINLTPKVGSTQNGLSLLQVMGTLSRTKYKSLQTPDKIEASSVHSSFYPQTNVLAMHQGDWASRGESNPWIRFDWNEAQTLNAIIIKDRANLSDFVEKCQITFSDGSYIEVKGIANNGEKKVVKFPNKTIHWIKLDLKGNGKSINNGLELVDFELR